MIHMQSATGNYQAVNGPLISHANHRTVSLQIHNQVVLSDALGKLIVIPCVYLCYACDPCLYIDVGFSVFKLYP
jgi:hypothetical protein